MAEGDQSFAGETHVGLRPGLSLLPRLTVRPYVVPGLYYLYQLLALDFAGNVRPLTGSEFGGETDFSALLPDGHTITLTD